VLAAVDVDYRDPDAVAACVLFADWVDEAPSAEWTCAVRGVLPYVPGRFFEREQPCILEALKRASAPPTLVVVDGHVWLDVGRKGLGAHLHDALGVAVVGVAKTAFLGAPSIAVVRGASAQPLYVSAVGIDPARAAADVARMHGAHRIPTLLKRVDRICRDASP
jgi:deoxyribonuclease V